MLGTNISYIYFFSYLMLKITPSWCKCDPQLRYNKSEEWNGEARVQITAVLMQSSIQGKGRKWCISKGFNLLKTLSSCFILPHPWLFLLVWENRVCFYDIVHHLLFVHPTRVSESEESWIVGWIHEEWEKMKQLPPSSQT